MMLLNCGCRVVGKDLDTCDEHNAGRIRDAVSEVSDTLRDEFAKAALIGLVRSSAEHTVDDYGPAHVASDAYSFADAMLKARAQ